MAASLFHSIRVGAFWLLVGFAFAGQSRGDAVTSEIYGLLHLSAPANTDTPVSTVFARPAIWRSAVASVSGATITVSGTPGWTANALAPAADTYHVRVTSGTLNGQFFTITTNSAAAVTVDAAGFDLSAIQPGDTMEISPYWTLGTLYPASQAGAGFIASSSPGSRETELLFFDPNTSGINRAPSASYFFYTGAWRKVGASVATSFDATIIYPDSYFLQRNKTLGTTLSFSGRVMSAHVGTVLDAIPAGQNDNYVAIAYPVDVTLARSGLSANGFAASPSPGSIADRLLLFDPAGTGYNRAPSATYYFYNGGWRKVGASVATDFSNTVTVPAGMGFIVRKAASASASTWQFDTQL